MRWRAETTVKDARGRIVPLATTSAAQRARLAAAANRKQDRWSRHQWLLHIMFCLLLVALVSFVPVGLPLPMWLGVPLGLSILLGPLITIVWLDRRIGAEQIARRFGRAGLCGSCAYELRDIPPDAEGLTTCPECGAAWRLV